MWNLSEIKVTFDLLTFLVFVYELENTMIYDFFMNVFSHGIFWAAWEVNHYLKKLIIWDIDEIIKSKDRAQS